MPNAYELALDDARAKKDVDALIELAFANESAIALAAIELAIAESHRLGRVDRWSAALYRCLSAHRDGPARIVRSFGALAELPEKGAPALEHVLNWVTRDAPEPELFREFWTWFERVAGTNQAEIVTKWLMLGWPDLVRGRRPPSHFGRIVEWAMKNGSGLLRGSGTGTALRALLVYADLLSPHLLPNAAALLLESRSRDGALACDGGVAELLLPQLDRALARKLDLELVRDLFDRSPKFRELCGYSPYDGDWVPVVVAFDQKGPRPLLDLIVSSKVRQHAVVLRDAIERVVSRTDVSSQVQRVSSDMLERNESPQSIVDALVRRALVGPLQAEYQFVVEHMAIHRDAVDLVVSSLRNLAAQDDGLLGDTRAKVLEFLATDDRYSVPLALIVAFAPVRTIALPVPEPQNLGAVAAILEELLRSAAHPSAHPFIAQCVGNPRSVEIRERCTDPNFVAAVEGDVWVAASLSLYEGFIRKHGPEEGLQCCALYFAHEMVHHAQGLADKRDVLSLRRNGSEQFVLELDLCADMLAIEWGAMLGRPRWTREALHELTLRLFDEFPATAQHIQPSVIRKSLRILCHLMTRHQRPHEFGWAWLELPAISGEATVWWSHPESHRIFAFELSQPEVEWARTCARDASLGAMDRRVNDWISRQTGRAGRTPEADENG